MSDRRTPITILLADDDEEDRMLASEALEAARLGNDLRFVSDGEELLAYLRHEGKYADPESSPRPGVILLDLNMPRMDGREALEHIKSDPTLRKIPVVIMTTSRAEEDIDSSYDHGACRRRHRRQPHFCPDPECYRRAGTKTRSPRLSSNRSQW